MNLCLDALRYKMIRETESFLQRTLRPREQEPASEPLSPPSGATQASQPGDSGGYRSPRTGCASGPAALARPAARQDR